MKTPKEEGIDSFLESLENIVVLSIMDLEKKCIK